VSTSTSREAEAERAPKDDTIHQRLYRKGNSPPFLLHILQHKTHIPAKADNRPAPSNGMGHISLSSTVFLFPFHFSFLSTEIVPQGQSPANEAGRD
jgi:hypothetical protein